MYHRSNEPVKAHFETTSSPMDAKLQFPRRGAAQTRLLGLWAARGSWARPATKPYEIPQGGREGRFSRRPVTRGVVRKVSVRPRRTSATPRPNPGQDGPNFLAPGGDKGQLVQETSSPGRGTQSRCLASFMKNSDEIEFLPQTSPANSIDPATGGLGQPSPSLLLRVPFMPDLHDPPSRCQALTSRRTGRRARTCSTWVSSRRRDGVLGTSPKPTRCAALSRGAVNAWLRPLSHQHFRRATPFRW